MPSLSKLGRYDFLEINTYCFSLICGSIFLQFFLHNLQIQYSKLYNLLIVILYIYVYINSN